MLVAPERRQTSLTHFKHFSPCSDSHAALMVGDARFHKECLRCCVCRCGLDGKMVTLDKENRPYCSKDYDK